MDACKTTPEPYIATIKLAPPLKKVFPNVLFERLDFPSYWIGAARNSIPESVQMELTEIPDVRRIDPETLQKLTESIVQHYTSLNLATAAALDNIVVAKTSLLISGGSTVLSFFLFIPNFPLFHRQAHALCCAPRRFVKNKSGQFIHVTEDIDPDSDSSLLIITRDELTSLRALAKEAFLKTEANAPFLYSAEDEAKLYPDITAQTRTIHTTPPLVPTTFTPTRYLTSITHKSPQLEYLPQVMYHSVYMYKVHLLKQVSLKKVNASSEPLYGTSVPPSPLIRHLVPLQPPTVPHLPQRRRHTRQTPYTEKRSAPTLPVLLRPEPHAVLFVVNLSFLPEFPLYLCVPFVILPQPLSIVLTPNA